MAWVNGREDAAVDGRMVAEVLASLGLEARERLCTAYLAGPGRVLRTGEVPSPLTGFL